MLAQAGGADCRAHDEDSVQARAVQRAISTLGRIELFNTTFETMERNIRDQMAGPGSRRI